MEKVKVKREYASAIFAGQAEAQGLNVGQRYRISIAHFVDLGSLQVHIDTKNVFFFINYDHHDQFELEWKEFKKLSKRVFFERPVNS